VHASVPAAFVGKKLRSPRCLPPLTMASVTHHVLCDSIATITSTSPLPVDSTACPSLVFELAPRTDDPDSINDESYQQAVAQATANALILWKDAAQPPPHLAPPEPEPNPAEANTP